VPLRLALAAIFIAHGSQKVFGSFGGPGLAQFTSSAAPFPFMRPSWLWMGAAAFAELIGGGLLLLGLLTRVGAFLIACIMVTAIAVHRQNGFFASNQGYEYLLALLAMCLALLISGGGIASIDRGLSGGRRR